MSLHKEFSKGQSPKIHPDPSYKKGDATLLHLPSVFKTELIKQAQEASASLVMGVAGNSRQ